MTVGTGASGVRGDLRAFRPAAVALRVIIADVPAPFPASLDDLIDGPRVVGLPYSRARNPYASSCLSSRSLPP
ncbi:MAG TPA: hypothetical protein VFD73_22640 [Gemmatimonadales bacterium]|nr:hypothetical protein [Gemmatimonadales bacterium]